LPKRSLLTVTIAAIPKGAGNDTPTEARVYVAAQDADPGASGTAWKLRPTIAYPSTSATIDPYQSIGSTQPKAVNEFGSTIDNPGLIQSTTGKSFWKGDDSAQFQQLAIVGTNIADYGAGVMPPLRIKNTNATTQTNYEMRIDNNQILAADASGNPVNLQLNMGTQDGPVTIRGMIKAGTKNSGSITSGTQKTVSVTFGTAFPASASLPTISLTPNISSVATYPNVAATNISRSGFDIVLIRGNATAFDVFWTAIATSSS